MRFFTPQEDAFLLDNYMTLPAKRMSVMLGRSESSARQRMALLGIIVPKEISEKFKAESQFKKGSVSFNKGKKMREYVSPEAIARMARTQFKKGNVPPNTKERDGVISIRRNHKDRHNSKPYKHIRISLGKWKLYHQYRWEKFRGDVPAGHCLWFIDGDTMNTKLSNLECITRAENAKRNKSRFDKYPIELKDVIKLNNKINKKLNEKLNCRN